VNEIIEPVSRERIEALQAAISKLPQAELETRHYWADGMYCRELFRPAGTTIVGKVHKKEHLLIIAQGTIRVWTEEGMKTVSAPFIWVSQPGTKRATFALTDATVVTIHRCAERDLVKLENELVEDDPNAMYLPGNVLKALQIEEST
jgi:hypothetical protein